LSGDQHSMSSNKYNRYYYHVSQYRKTVPIQEIDMNTEKWYRYRRSVRIQKNNINNDFKLFTTIKKRIIFKLSTGKRVSKQANIQAELSKAGAKLTHSTRRHHVRRGYRSRYS